MKKMMTILFFNLSLTVFSQTKQDTIWNRRFEKLEQQVNDVEKGKFESEIAPIKDKIELQQKINEQSYNNISNQISAASYNLTLFGILFAIAAIGVGAYVTHIERKIIKIREDNQVLLLKSQKIKEDVELVNELIQKDIYKLFLKMKREESVHILDRLVQVPRDISNVCQLLLSRELYQEDFAKVKQAYLNLPKLDRDDYKHSYLVLFFQHFFGQSLKDEYLREHISAFIPIGINSAFENDIVKSMEDLALVIIEKGAKEFKAEINSFFEGLSRSEFKNLSIVYSTLFDSLKSRKNQFEVFDVIESESNRLLAKIEFGNLLLTQYLNQNLTESEKLSFNKLEEDKNKVA